jgi:NAD(P)-dependent dehydrogenase (short-subunit alcohol dehydrogenase family)
MKSLNGIQGVVTGGASGIGRATVEALAAQGTQVRVVSRSADKLEKVKQEVKGQSRSSRATSRIRPWWRDRRGRSRRTRWCSARGDSRRTGP